MVVSKWLMDKEIKARIELYRRHPFFATLAQHLEVVETKAIPTAAVTWNNSLLINPDFAKKLDHKGMVFVNAHEVMHIVTACFDRRPPGADNIVWNQANDIRINQMIHYDSEMEVPDPEVIKPLGIGPDFEKYKDNQWQTELIYRDLMQNRPEESNCPFCGKGENEGEDEGSEGGGQGSGEDNSDCPFHGDDCDNHGHSTGSDADGDYEGYWWDDSAERIKKDKPTEQQKEEWRKRISSAAAKAKSAGQLPGGLEAFVTDILHPKHDWRQVLLNSVRSSLKGRWTWRKTGRRTAGIVRTPGRDPKPPEALIYIDTSGSMSDDELRRAIAEIAEILRLTGGKGRLLLGDAEIYYDGEIDIGSLTNLPIQRGGTDFRPVFDKIAEGTTPKIFVGFSDLCGPFPENAPDYPVIWCVPKSEYGMGSAPWGETIEVDL
jgi:predicted metal-dependent peptidase